MKLMSLMIEVFYLAGVDEQVRYKVDGTDSLKPYKYLFSKILRNYGEITKTIYTFKL